ncbi:hypothetical protein FDECE_17198 [Fusarium decemcellulare]|nr:hypothetical protein FDECE_17198 [Fusarium decemcellulare]
MASDPENDAASSGGDSNDSVGTKVKNGLSDKQMETLKAWIKDSPDPAPNKGDVTRKSKALFNRRPGKWRRYSIEQCLEDRELNGPSKKDGCLMLPGYGLPLTYMINSDSGRHPFLFGLNERDWAAPTLMNREVCILKFVEDITNKPEWWIKVRNPEIIAKWKQEVLAIPWSEYQQNADFTDKMADTCFIELEKKAELYEETGLIPVMDYSAFVIKSDTLLTDDLRDELRSAVKLLEDVPKKCQDWHPGSDGKVLDLVHPSLWPLVYGLSRILPDKRIPVENCIDYCGAGSVIPKPIKPIFQKAWYSTHPEPSENRAISTRFQWLPCDVDLTGEHPRIESYINNLHPVEHKNLYRIIERFIEKSLPAWQVVSDSSFETYAPQRLDAVDFVDWGCTVPDICEGDCYPSNRRKNQSDDDDEDEDEADEVWWKATHHLKLPDARFDPDEIVPLKADKVLKTGFFDGASRIQVIVKLANIHLTPEKPTYDGGSWHVEGQVNEHICATALFYYDCDNITESRLAFRTSADGDRLTEDLHYQQGDYSGIEGIFAIDASGSKLQNIGSVLTREGRALFFPNVYQHRVEPFELADKTRPGHRKILALFLVDPFVPIISTANIPPQRRDWWAEGVQKVEPFSNLPTEIREMVEQNVDFPYGLDKAKEIREELMEERRAVTEDTDDRLQRQDWSFCEH